MEVSRSVAPPSGTQVSGRVVRRQPGLRQPRILTAACVARLESTEKYPWLLCYSPRPRLGVMDVTNPAQTANPGNSHLIQASSAFLPIPYPQPCNRFIISKAVLHA